MSKIITGASGEEYIIKPRADLSDADLNDVDLRKAKLWNANL